MAVLFFFYIRLLCLFSPHVWFLLRCFLSAVIAGLFPLCRNRCCVVNFDFNWFHLRFFPPLVMSLWIWISLESYAFVKFYLILSKEDNNGFCFMILILTIFFPTDSDSSFSWWLWHLPFFLTFLLGATVLSAFSSAFSTPFFFASVVALRLNISPSYPWCLHRFDRLTKSVSEWTSRSGWTVKRNRLRKDSLDD